MQTTYIPYNGIEPLRLLSINEARKLLRIRHSSVVNLVDNGEIESITINKRRKIPYLKLTKYINQYSTKTSLINNSKVQMMMK